jgi:hypothetical protein
VIFARDETCIVLSSQELDPEELLELATELERV